MSFLTSSGVAFVYGAAVIASGMIRYFGSAGGHAGLWFGIVMGSVALAAGGCFLVGKDLVGKILIWFSILVVGGWFVFEALIKKGVLEAEIRMLAILVMTAASAAYYLTSFFQTSKS